MTIKFWFIVYAPRRCEIFHLTVFSLVDVERGDIEFNWFLINIISNMHGSFLNLVRFYTTFISLEGFVHF